MRSLAGTSGSAKKPISKVVAQTITSVAMNAAAEAKTGWHLAVSHSISGNTRAMGTAIVQRPSGAKMANPTTAVSAVSAPMPSSNSAFGGGLRRVEQSPIKSGATVMMPMASDANQCRQMVIADAVELWNSTYATVPPRPEALVAMAEATTNPST